MSRPRVAVLGTGRVGAAIVRDLAATGQWEVCAYDGSAAALGSLASEGIFTRRSDLSSPTELASAVDGCDLVVGAVPGFLGYQVAKTVLELGRNLVDISFFPEDPFPLAEIALERGVVAAVDCGVAPGASHLLAGYAATKLDRFDRYRCLVGGLPMVRRKPFEYSAPFSPIDVIEEYVRPARSIRGGKLVTLPALSEVELVDLPGVGTVEAFATDGLRSLLHKPLAPEMEEKTLRWPGHAELMRVFRELGLFGEEPHSLRSGATVVPRELTASLLFDAWTPEPGAPELTVMQVEAEGLLAGVPTKWVWDLLDAPDPGHGVSSMARTTGYTCTAIVDLVAHAELLTPGLWLPEHIGALDGGWARVLRYLEDRDVRVSERQEEVPGTGYQGPGRD